MTAKVEEVVEVVKKKGIRPKPPVSYTQDVLVVQNPANYSFHYPSGSFGLLSLMAGGWYIGVWTSCRESFHINSENLTRFLFIHKNKSHLRIAAFIEQLEKKLKLKTKTVFGPTARPNVMWIQPSPWWWENGMRRSLFTIFLRAGQKYNRKIENFSEILLSHPYAKKTEYAISRFMKGYTRYTGNMTGWYNAFYYDGNNMRLPDKEKVDILLVKP